jgi:hypothetical protein
MRGRIKDEHYNKNDGGLLTGHLRGEAREQERRPGPAVHQYGEDVQPNFTPQGAAGPSSGTRTWKPVEGRNN